MPYQGKRKPSMLSFTHIFKAQLPSVIAFCGAGGKTSALFQLARDHGQRCVVTTTTHFGAWHADEADQHVMICQPDDLALLDDCDGNVILVTGEKTSDNRLKHPTPDVLAALHEYCLAQQLLLLIEADGARGRAIKAPADHEPVIPDWVDMVIVSCGMTALAEQLNENRVHRPQIFAELTGLKAGEIISVERVARLLAHPMGGLKGLPRQASHVLLLNQADDALLQGKAGKLAGHLMPHYDQVVIASLVNHKIHAVYRDIGAVILAAGAASRYGSAKQLLAYHGKPFIRVVAEKALKAGLSPVNVVVGADAAQMEAALQGLPVTIVMNDAWQAGMSTSFKAGFAALPKKTFAAICLLADQPQIPLPLLDALKADYYESLAPIVAPLVDGFRANPVLFSRETFSAMQQISGDQGGRALFNHFPVRYITWLDADARLDVDDQAAYQRLIDENL